MRAVGDYLVRKEDGMILLLAPPFDRMLPDRATFGLMYQGAGERWPVYPCRHVGNYGYGYVGRR